MTRVIVERIAAGGDGVGRLDDGMTVFVPRSAPGDVLEIDVRERKRTYARADVISIESAGPDRVEPGCRHYVRDRCGGCRLQHLSPEAQLLAKQRIVGDAIRRIGRRDAADPPIVASPAAWRYRRKITLAASGGRIGLHPVDAPDTVFDLEDCPITARPIMDLWNSVRAHRELLPEGLTSLVLREDRSGGRHVIVRGDEPRPWNAALLADEVALPDVSYWWRPERGATRIVAGGRAAFPALAFEQVNPDFAARIRADALAAIGRPAVAWDLYAGVGDAGAELAAQGTEVWAVEMDRSAVEWARAQGVKVHWVAGRVEESLHRLPKPEAVIANPPRTGMDKVVAEWLEGWARAGGGGCLAYVSCDPATLARDLSRMPSLALRQLTAYDLFPQTSHVEVLAVLYAV